MGLAGMTVAMGLCLGLRRRIGSRGRLDLCLAVMARMVELVKLSG